MFIISTPLLFYAPPSSFLLQYPRVSTSTCTPLCSISPPSPQPSRRTFLKYLPLTLLLSLPSPTHSAIDYPELHGLDDTPTPSRPPFVTLSTGVKLQDLTPGIGDETISPGAQVSVKYVLRRSNGYFIDASYGFDRFESFVFRSGKGDVIDGFEQGVEGMKVGGRRRFVVPPDMGYVRGVGKGSPGPIPPEFGGKRSLASHAKEPLVFEVQVVKIRP